MPLLGAHMSISGGLDRALYRGKEVGCSVIQIFTRNTTRWNTKALSPAQVHAFWRAREETSIETVAAHDSYLINPASPLAEIRRKSFIALFDEMNRAERLGIPYLVIHPGAHLHEGVDVGIRRVSEMLDRIYDRCGRFRVHLLLETTAGQGTNLGYRFEHLAEIIEKTDSKERLGLCLDTCHVFAAGYDFRTHETYMALMKEFDEIIGLERLKLVHLNDSKRERGMRVDRHEHPGYGKIGKKGISFFLRDSRLKDLPMLIETPKGRNEQGIDWDKINLELLKSLMEEKTADDSV